MTAGRALTRLCRGSLLAASTVVALLSGCADSRPDLEAIVMAAKAVKPEPLSGAAPVALGAARSLSPPLVIASRNPFAPANTPNPVDCAQAHLGTLLLAQLQVIGIEARAGKGSVVLALPDGRWYRLHVGEQLGRDCATLRAVRAASAVFDLQGREISLPVVPMPGAN